MGRDKECILGSLGSCNQVGDTCGIPKGKVAFVPVNSLVVSAIRDVSYLTIELCGILNLSVTLRAYLESNYLIRIAVNVGFEHLSKTTFTSTTQYLVLPSTLQLYRHQYIVQGEESIPFTLMIYKQYKIANRNLRKASL